MKFADVLRSIREQSLTEKEKGTKFEQLMKRWLRTDPRYAALTDVWLWEEFPAKKDLGGKDLGIDLVARTDMGDYWAIQCKCYAEDAHIDKPAVDSFLANASRSFMDVETMQTRTFDRLLWIDTTRGGWGPNALQAIQGLNVGFNRINLFELEQAAVDWERLWKGHAGDEALLPGKQPRPHQIEAITKAHRHFIEEGNTRGKLIMACGTGKTYTALRIMEELTDQQALVLFLVPSIALLGQTLNAWMADRRDPLRAICVCSDASVSKKMQEADAVDEAVSDLALPATTNQESILRQLKAYAKKRCRTVIFSTYQSIEAVSAALLKAGRTVDLCICDEAHRTTGVKLTGKDESAFTKVHDDAIIPAHRRLYMTATPRLYRESVKLKAKENDDLLCSMDDEAIYGQEFHRLSFNEAVRQQLLTDYKVLVLTVNEQDLPPSVQEQIKVNYAEASKEERLKELNFDDATKLVGCINGLSKRIQGDDGVTRQQDPVMMKRAVAFCQTIRPTQANPNASSTQMARHFASVCQDYKAQLSPEEAAEVVNVEAKHIDGSMDAKERNRLISWLKEENPDPMGCRVLCNVRCLSEGVDVPALDAVLFLSPRNSEVEVVQSVGRVMRSFGRGTEQEKKYGYIIIPIIVPADVKPEEALADNERFKVVWTILNALRSHDEAFNAKVNQINLNRRRTPKIIVANVPTGQYGIGEGEEFNGKNLHESGSEGKAVQLDSHEVARQLDLRFGNLQDGIYARIVEKVGDKLYWENWSRDVGRIALKFIERIAALIQTNPAAKTDFTQFVEGLRKNINPSVSEGQAIEMLAQHMIVRPVFDALFADYQFVRNNAVSRSMQAMIERLEAEGFAMDTEVLERFYQSVRVNVGEIDNLEGKQTIIKQLYEKFFKGAFPKSVEQLGIVYTPVECVDFILHSVDHLLRQEFQTALTEENVHILDPFTGTGTFITRLLQSGLIRPEDMERKYRQEIHCNEIVLLAYYVADVNIESVFHDQQHPETYQPYDGICLTDTFQLNEEGDNDIFSQLFPENSERLRKQKRAPIRVIIGNPPYSVGQKSANDNAQNLKYAQLEQRIAETYAAGTQATNKNSLYDSYIKAFRWASDRIAQCPEGGIVGFVTNSGWIEKLAFEGFRSCLEKEYTSVYVLDLKGAVRGKSGETAKREGQSIFNILTGVAITFLVKNPAKKGKAAIYYYNIGDYLKREEKLTRLRQFVSVKGIDWKTIVPNEKQDWINQRGDEFDTLILLGDKDNRQNKQTFFEPVYSRGVATARDAWCYCFNKQQLKTQIKDSFDFYTQEMKRYQAVVAQIVVIGEIEKTDKKDLKLPLPKDIVNMETTKLSWNRGILNHCRLGKALKYKTNNIFSSLYRPFCKEYLYFDADMNDMVYQLPKLFPTPHHENLVICTSSIGDNKDFACIMTDCVPDLHLNQTTQCFPLYYYIEKDATQLSLFDAADANGKCYERHEAITDWILKEVRQRYNAPNFTRETIFYYVYGLLHSADYRSRFADDLKKSLPRIPLVERAEDFIRFSKAGKELAKLHLDYERVKPCPAVTVEGDRPLTHTEADYDFYRIPDKMRFRSKEDKSTILYNGHLTVTGIPAEAYQYVVNGKSAIEWIVERYAVTTDKKSLIRNDSNDWAREHRQPRYILDLLLSVIQVSLETQRIVQGLPRLEGDGK